MARTPVYLEIADDGTCMAHVLALPGCTVRAPAREEVLCQLPEAITAYYAWLRSHGEPAPAADAAIEIEIAGESRGYGPFDPGDAAALFPPDREPLSMEEMARYLHLMAYSRADLLTLVQPLPDDLLDWQPDPESHSLRQVLRHVGNAEEWYVSRLVPPDTLPPEWEHDEGLALFEFLEMERRTAVARLRRLTEQERSGLLYPTAWTRHPEEPWTARKALRRFLEHEREHTVQVREILAARRRWLLGRLAAERAGLLQQIADLDAKVMSEVPVVGSWTVKDVLAHVAAWERWEERAMRAMVAGEEPDFAAVEDVDSANTAWVAAWHDRGVDEVLAELRAARADWVAWLESLPEEEFFRPRSHHGYDWTFVTVPLPIMWAHDAEHAAQIAAWRGAQLRKGGTSP